MFQSGTLFMKNLMLIPSRIPKRSTTNDIKGWIRVHHIRSFYLARFRKGHYMINWFGLSFWITPGWYKYLFAKRASRDISWLVVLKCRIRGHHGVVWYNASGLEPDMTCKVCGDDLG